MPNKEHSKTEVNKKEKWVITFNRNNWEVNIFPEFNSIWDIKEYVERHGILNLYTKWCTELGITPTYGDVECTAGVKTEITPTLDAKAITGVLLKNKELHGGVQPFSETQKTINGQFHLYKQQVPQEVLNELTESLTKAYIEWEEANNMQSFIYKIDPVVVIQKYKHTKK